MRKVFIVEDDQTIVESLKKALSENFQVRSVQNFCAVEQEILEFEADLVLMDIGLPFYGGFFWTERLREKSKIPIIFISSTSDEMNQVTAMNQGADDYVTKPFSIAILQAKMEAILRRSYPEELRFAGFVLDTESIYAENQSNQVVELTPAEKKILAALFRAQGKLVSREKLLQELWQTDEFIDANALSVKMTRLRKKLSDISFDQHIVTKRGEGYVLE